LAAVPLLDPGQDFAGVDGLAFFGEDALDCALLGERISFCIFMASTTSKP